MDLKDFVSAPIESAKSAISERWGNPVAGPFMLFWITWNHKLLMVLFSSGKYDEKWVFLAMEYRWTFKSASDLFLIPFVLSLLYLAIAPFSRPMITLTTYTAQTIDSLIKRAFFGLHIFTSAEHEALLATREKAHSDELAKKAKLLADSDAVATDLKVRCGNAHERGLKILSDKNKILAKAKTYNSDYPIRHRISNGAVVMLGNTPMSDFYAVEITLLEALIMRKLAKGRRGEIDICAALPDHHQHHVLHHLACLCDLGLTHPVWPIEELTPTYELTGSGEEWLPAFGSNATLLEQLGIAERQLS